MLIQFAMMVLAIAGLINIFGNNILPGFACICFAGILAIMEELNNISQKLDTITEFLRRREAALGAAAKVFGESLKEIANANEHNSETDS